MEHAKSIVHLSCDPLVLSNVLHEATHLEIGLLYVRGALQWNFDWMWVFNPATKMSRGFLGLDERLATFYVRREKAQGIAR